MIVGEADDAVALLDNVLNRSGQDSIAEHQLHSDARALSGLYQRFPGVEIVLAEQKQLDQRLLPSLDVSVQTGGNDLGVVDDEHVVRFQIINDIEEMLVCDLAACTVKHHQTGVITLLHRMLCDQLLGKIVKEVRGAKRGFWKLIDNGLIHV